MDDRYWNASRTIKESKLELDRNSMWEYIRGQYMFSVALKQRIPPALSWIYFQRDADSSIWFHTNRRLLQTFDGESSQVRLVHDRRVQPSLGIDIEAIVSGPCCEISD